MCNIQILVQAAYVPQATTRRHKARAGGWDGDHVLLLPTWHPSIAWETVFLLYNHLTPELGAFTLAFWLFAHAIRLSPVLPSHNLTTQTASEGRGWRTSPAIERPLLFCLLTLPPPGQSNFDTVRCDKTASQTVETWRINWDGKACLRPCRSTDAQN